MPAGDKYLVFGRRIGAGGNSGHLIDVIDSDQSILSEHMRKNFYIVKVTNAEGDAALEGLNTAKEQGKRVKLKNQDKVKKQGGLLPVEIPTSPVEMVVEADV